MAVKRVAVFFSRLSGYMSACFQHLKEQNDIKLLVIRVPPAENAPFDPEVFNCFDEIHDRNTLNTSDMKKIITKFDPDAMYLSGWFDRGYLNVARNFRKKGGFVVAGSDTQWQGTLRQQAARLISPVYLHSAIDALWVAGERQRQFAKYLGFSGQSCWDGVYACDWKRFDAEYANQDRSNSEHNSFLYIGRYIERKGIDVLLNAYRNYRNAVDDPWDLVCAGKGELEPLIEQEPGVINKGFIQPDELPALMRENNVFVLPSRVEPWGVVIQEAAATGLPLICSDACGATVHLLRDGYNGFVFESGNIDQITEYLLQISTMTHQKRVEFGTRSHELSKQYTPKRWAETFMTHLAKLG